MKRISALLSILALASCGIFGDRWDENRLRGFYILERVDGALLPVTLAPEQGCSRTVRRIGTLHLSGGGPETPPSYGWNIWIDNDCLPARPFGNPGAEDVGYWSLHSDQQLTLRSIDGRGENPARAEEASGHPTAVTLTYLGNSYRFRRTDDRFGVVSAKFVDQFGQPVAGVILRSVFRYGLEDGGTTPGTGESGARGPVGEASIGFTPPAGYEVPPSQANPVSVTVVAEPATVEVLVVLTKTAAG